MFVYVGDWFVCLVGVFLVVCILFQVFLGGLVGCF